MLTKFEIQKLAQASKIDEHSLLREYLQILVLQSIYGQPGCESTYFKGGTAIKLLLGSFRFSEDLDFTTAATEPAINKILTNSAKEVGSLTSSLVDLVKTETVGNNFTYRFKFTNLPIPAPVFIKTDFSTRESVLDPVTSVLTTTLPISPLPIVKHLSAKELLAEKVRAITHRLKGRDLFDLWFLLSRGEKLDWDLINKKAAYYHETATKNELLKRLDDFSDKTVRQDLDKFLPANYRQVDLDLVNKIKATVG